jgi:hypothetical protein
MVRGTLELYTGAGKPDLLVTQAEAGRDIDGSEAFQVPRSSICSTVMPGLI